MTSDQLRGRRVLVVEDESLILLTVLDILEDLGCEVAGTAKAAGAAVALLETAAVDAALLDVNLGNGQTSYPVAEALAGRGIPFAFVTGYGIGDLPAEMRDRPILSKPVDQRSLEAVLVAMLEAEPARGA